MEIKEKWKTDGRKHATGTGIQAALYIVYKKRKGALRVILSHLKQHHLMICFTTTSLLNQGLLDSNCYSVARI